MRWKSIHRALHRFGDGLGGSIRGFAFEPLLYSYMQQFLFACRNFKTQSACPGLQNESVAELAGTSIQTL